MARPKKYDHNLVVEMLNKGDLTKLLDYTTMKVLI